MNTKIKGAILNLLLLSLTIVIAIPVGKAVGTYYNETRSHSVNGNFRIHVEKLPHSLTLYGTSYCVHCRDARDYLRKAGVPFNDIVLDKSKDAEAQFKNIGVQSVPVLVSAKRYVSGFHPEEFDELIKVNEFNRD
jgi:glutaredoxin